MTSADTQLDESDVARCPPAPRPALAGWWLLALSGVVVAALVAVSGRYGYHRDELYFLQAGRHLAFGYVDQPPFTPLLARTATAVFGDSLVGLRFAASLAAGGVVLVTGLLAREFGGDRSAQLLAAGCMAVSAVLLAVGHLLSTTTFDLLAWTTLSLLVVRALRGGGWLSVGLVAGIGLQNKALVAFLLCGLGVGLLVAGPRPVLRTAGPWMAVGIALLLWTPNLIWQASHGWPQLELSTAIAAGGSGSSQPRSLFVPFQLVLVSPFLVPVWVAGLWRLARAPALRRFRAFAVAYAFLTLVFLLTGGKPYYLAGLYPVLLAAGALPLVHWVRAGNVSRRRSVLGVALGLSGLVSAVLMLPLVPVGDLATTPIVTVNYDAGETVGWPALVRTVSGVYDALPPAEQERTIVLTRNYGQAGAVARYASEYKVPQSYSGHNSYADWGPPPESAATAIVIGYDRPTLEQWFGSVAAGAKVNNGVGLDNDEQGTPIWVCRQRRASWARLWPNVRHLG